MNFFGSSIMAGPPGEVTPLALRAARKAASEMSVTPTEEDLVVMAQMLDEFAVDAIIECLGDPSDEQFTQH